MTVTFRACNSRALANLFCGVPACQQALPPHEAATVIGCDGHAEKPRQIDEESGLWIIGGRVQAGGDAAHGARRRRCGCWSRRTKLNRGSTTVFHPDGLSPASAKAVAVLSPQGREAVADRDARMGDRARATARQGLGRARDRRSAASDRGALSPRACPPGAPRPSISDGCRRRSASSSARWSVPMRSRSRSQARESALMPKTSEEIQNARRATAIAREGRF